MKPNSVLKLKHVAWASVGLLVVILVVATIRSGAKPAAKAPDPDG